MILPIEPSVSQHGEESLHLALLSFLGLIPTNPHYRRNLFCCYCACLAVACDMIEATCSAACHVKRPVQTPSTGLEKRSNSLVESDRNIGGLSSRIGFTLSSVYRCSANIADDHSTWFNVSYECAAHHDRWPLLGEALQRQL